MFKFCVTNEISYGDALQMLQKAFRESALSKTRAYGWFKDSKIGRTVVEDWPCSGRLATLNTNENVKKNKRNGARKPIFQPDRDC